MITITGSSAFTKAEYSASASTLTVFYNKGTYAYHGITDTDVMKLQNATSKGHELRSLIEGKTFTKVA